MNWKRLRLVALMAIVLLAFAGNSLLCRRALKETGIDPATFTSIRLAAGAAMLALIVRMRGGVAATEGNWTSALALFVYAIAFSFAYVALSAGMGALLLFGAVQATMIGGGLRSGERLTALQMAGLVVALAGLVGLLIPGLSAPAPWSAAMMIGAGVAWGVYSLRGRGAGDAVRVTAGNFIRALPFALAVSLLTLPWASVDAAGVAYAVASGALASGVGYAIWYAALPQLPAISAATLQLSVPVIAAIGGILLLGESLTLRLVLASIAVLGGVAVVIVLGPRRKNAAAQARAR